jgi:hypothetical protein
LASGAIHGRLFTQDGVSSLAPARGHDKMAGAGRSHYEMLAQTLGERVQTTRLARAVLLLLFLSCMLALGLWPQSCRPPPSCQLWSCSRPLASAPSDRWPAWPATSSGHFDRTPRDNLQLDAAKRWLAVHHAHVRSASSAAGSHARLAFLGDSITEGWVRTGFSSNAESIAQPECERIWRQAFGRCASAFTVGAFVGTCEGTYLLACTNR